MQKEAHKAKAQKERLKILLIWT